MHDHESIAHEARLRPTAEGAGRLNEGVHKQRHGVRNKTALGYPWKMSGRGDKNLLKHLAAFSAEPARSVYRVDRLTLGVSFLSWLDGNNLV
ncbi:hypothetical protein RRG08_022281 [Elysia crispata]|uniref:Uncharacterized protein n=1 Tax=Elysia crispata TaxID=231223 RepID=A0AAE0ZR94_9GAST|nr:hypothetical protein RRG08_022281 [Elysia crispata]